ncbi:MAG: UDP-N-acetylmuramoyl-tripeptide--D-alanyl-D-alanine ligase [Candidatus Omnitrophica bacterium]|nr:UDP-N-acetylmuramoyl-tripeptide--D-alanyl-D-alanine ligase [Candidatus Omnitrophota bacterium]
MPQYKVRDVLKVTGGKLLSGRTDATFDPSRVSTDTRSIKKGDIFLALKGGNFDANDFAEEAFKKGASGAIVSRHIPAPHGKFVIMAKDTTDALQRMAAYHRSKFRIPVIAITGSNGKTTVKDMIWKVLSSKYEVLRNEGTKNNHIGVPQTLLNLNDRHDICVLEFGTNHPGEIMALGLIARPTLSVITNIGPSHLEFLIDLEGVFREKKSILSAFDAKSKGVAVLNGDDPYLSRIRTRKITVKTVGFADGNFLRGAVKSVGRSFVDFTVNDEEQYRIKLLGCHNVYNALIAIAVGKHFNLGHNTIRKTLSSFRPTSMRLDLKEVKGFSVIDDSYNSNPLSMEKALDVINTFPAPSKWVVSGDMLELGKRSVDFHKSVGEMVAHSSASGLLTMGELSRHTLDKARSSGMDGSRLWHCSTHDEIASVLRRVLKKGDVVLLKGSRSMKMERVLDRL